MIASGEKNEEYREATRYWQKRFQQYKVALILDDRVSVTFSNGYQKNRRQVEVELKQIELGIGRAEWGASGELQYILHLGDIIVKKNKN